MVTRLLKRAVTLSVGSRSVVHRALIWVTVAQVARQLGQLVGAIILARLIAPADFGLMTMAVVVTGFLSVIRDLGVGAAVVQQEDLTEEFAGTQFWTAIGVGITASFILFVSAPLIAEVYSEHRVADILRVLSATFAIASFGIVHQARLERNMRFRAVAGVELLALAAGIAVAVTIATRGGGVWSLVAQVIVSVSLSTAGLWIASGWLPPLIFDAPSAVKAWRYGAPLTGFNAINFVTRNADYALIGRALGSSALGFYTLGYRLMLVPQQAIVAVVNRVMFPALAAVQREPEKMRRAYLHGIAGATFLAFPIAAAIGASADRLIPTVLGAGWEPAIDIVRMLAIVACLQTIGATVGPIYLATGRTRNLLGWGLVSGAVMVIAFVIGLNGGVLGVAFAYSVASVLLLYPSLALALRLIDLPVRTAFEAFSTSLLIGIATGGLMLLVGAVPPPDVPDVLVLISQLGVGGAAYLGGSWLFNREHARAAMSVLRPGRSVGP